MIQVRRRATTPAREAAAALFEQGSLLPLYQTLPADLETPVSIFIKLSQLSPAAFLLESVEGGEQVSRYSFLGVDPARVISVQNGVVTDTRAGQASSRPLAADETPLSPVRAAVQAYRPVQVEGLPRFIGGAVGYVGYDVVRSFERLPQPNPDTLNIPDLAFMFPDTLVIFDHVQHRLIVLANAHFEGDAEAAYDDAERRIARLVEVIRGPLPPMPAAPAPLNEEARSSVSQAEYEAAVRQAKEHIAAGDIFQVVLSQRFSRRTSAPPLAIYRALRALNPSPYMFYLKFSDDLALIGASPEMMVRLEDGIATTRPIAGTRKRGANDAEDAALAASMLADEKERAEHVMLVDLGRNDLGRVCTYGTVRVPLMMSVEKYSHVMHIVSTVEGKLKPGLDAFDLLRATFPAGTLSGAPKVRAMQIIDDLETLKRGAYGGAVGYFSYDGSMDTCITIRTILMQGDTIHVQAGAGIVADSDPAKEFEETVNKARALLVAVQQAEEADF